MAEGFRSLVPAGRISHCIQEKKQKKAEKAPRNKAKKEPKKKDGGNQRKEKKKATLEALCRLVAF